MITEQELQISNKSYINKDFASVYQEILELAKKISYKYDPETSNESDPFIIVLKLLAFVTDKLDYNIDKNVLERFMPSATQEESMRELCAMQGYDMHYYIAPTTKVTFNYIGDEADAAFNAGGKFILPRLDTIVTTDDGSIQYVTTSDVVILGKNQVSYPPVEVIQGQKKRLVILNSEKVLLENIDDNNRVYFPEQMVAENGIFISGGTITNADEWRLVSNLNTQEIGSYVYKFGFDSNKRLPYIEFPNDIANLIGSGLTIDYIITDGVRGNVKARALNRLNSPTQVYIEGSTTDTVKLVLDAGEKQPIVVTNTNASINGKDPETIEEAYNGYKKTIGTFDTLVTCRDYLNFIYNLLDDDGIYPLVSNLQVSDRRTDINAANKITTYNQYGQYIINEPVTTDSITAYDLCLYPLRPMYDFTLQSYKESFLQLVDTLKIENKTSDSKCISHDYVHPEDINLGAETKKLFALKNYYNLTAKIATTYKVNNSEQIDILSNINTALVKKFNARNVDFGYELPYDIILETIENADERIKSVVLSEPDLVTKVMTTEKDSNGNVTNEEVELLSNEGKEYYKKLVAKNVLAGNVELFNYDNRFDFDYGQKQSVLASNIVKVFSEAGITLSNNTEYTLNANEVVQLMSPSLITKVTYPYGIGYNLKLNSPKTEIAENEEYQLQSGEYCVFVYTNADNVQVVDIYKEGRILKSKLPLKTTIAHGGTSISKTIVDRNNRDELNNMGALESDGTLKVYILSTNDEVEYRDLNSIYMSNPVYCYWIVNNADNEIWFTGSPSRYTYILKEGEYFFQTDLGFNNLYTYGSGTMIIQSGFVDETTQQPVWKAEKVDLSVLDEKGILGNKDKFVERDVTLSDHMLGFMEHTIITLTEEDTIKYTSDTVSSFALSNDFTSIGDKNISYKFKGDNEFTPLTKLSYLMGDWEIRSRLDLNVGPHRPQTLVGHQYMRFTQADTGTRLVIKGDDASVPNTFCLSEVRQIAGGGNINIGKETISDTLEIVYAPIYGYGYTLDTATASKNRSADGYEVVTISPSSSVTRTLPAVTGSEYHSTTVMIYVNGEVSETTYPKLTITGCTTTDLNKSVFTLTSPYKLEGLKVFTFYATSPTTAQFEISSEGGYSGTVVIGKPRVIYGRCISEGTDNIVEIDAINPVFGFETDQEALDLYNQIATYDREDIFYYNNIVDNSKAIDVEDFRSPYALYDYNNIANKWTISEIDFNNSNISIMRGSRL